MALPVDVRRLSGFALTLALGWTPVETFATGIRKTVAWYLEHQGWVSNVQSGDYREWLDQQYGGAKLAA